jgi:hypothetical protein
MEQFPSHLIPKTYSFTDKIVDKFVSENDNIKTRPKPIGFSEIAVSFELSETDYLDFLEFYNVNLSYGMLNFEADWEVETVFEEYSFKDQLKISQVSDTMYKIETKLLKKFSYCNSDILDSLNCMLRIEKSLQQVNYSYEMTVPCSYEILQSLDCFKRIEKSLKLEL